MLFDQQGQAEEESFFCQEPEVGTEDQQASMDLQMERDVFRFAAATPTKNIFDILFHCNCSRVNQYSRISTFADLNNVVSN